MKSVYAKERESTSEKDRQKNGTNELTNKRTNERVKNKIQQQLWRYSTCGLRSDMRRRERERVRWCESEMVRECDEVTVIKHSWCACLCINNNNNIIGSNYV